MTPSLQEWLKQQCDADPNLGNRVEQRLRELRTARPQPMSPIQLLIITRISVAHIQRTPELRRVVERMFGRNWAPFIREDN